MRLTERHGAIDLDIAGERDLARDLLDDDVMDGDVTPRGDEQQPLDHRLVIERDGIVSTVSSISGCAAR